MNMTVIIPQNWEPFNQLAFAMWYKYHIKSKLIINEDFNLLNNG